MKNIPKEDWVIDGKYLFFWNSLYSQWYWCEFKDNFWITYSSAEKYMMMKKAELFEDLEIWDSMKKVNDPQILQELWRQIKNFNQEVWDKYKFQIVKKWNYLKFSQNPDLLKYLKKHKNLILVEWSPKDKIWGVGLHYKSQAIKNEKNWLWQNLLWKAIMEVRDQLLMELL